MLRGAQERPEGVSGASRECLGASPTRPSIARRVRKGDPGRKKERSDSPRSVPGRRESTPSRIRERKNQVSLVRLVREAMAEQCFTVVYRFSAFSSSPRTLQSTAPASKNRGAPLRAGIQVAHAMEPRKTTEMDPGFDLKASKIAPRGVMGAPDPPESPEPPEPPESSAWAAPGDHWNHEAP